MPPPNAISLQIIECSCACGNTWTHSYPILYGHGNFGGTPGPTEERTFPVQHILSSKRNYSHCFRCVDPALIAAHPLPSLPADFGTTVRPAKRPAKRLTLSDLDEDIFS